MKLLPPTDGAGANVWHGILTAAAVPLFTAIAWMLAPESIKIGTPALTFLGCWLACVLLAAATQWLYEYYQEHHTDVVAIYGSYDAFYADSDEDWKYWKFGAIASLPISTILLYFI